ncbi:Dorsal-ventral patterning protein tolloid, partial [Stegodyphus mimosarum]
MPECLPIKIFLEESTDYELLSWQQSSTMCVCEDKSEMQRFKLRPLRLGQVNIIAHVFSAEDESGICGTRTTAKFNATDVVLKKLFVEKGNISIERPSDITRTPQQEYLTHGENGCGGIFGGSNGTITSPSFPDPYPPNNRCVWDIVAPLGFNIILTFTHFDLGFD